MSISALSRRSAAPDLMVNRITTRESEVTNQLTLIADVVNLGSADAGPFTVSGEVENTARIYTENVSRLAAGDTRTVVLGPMPVHWNGQILMAQVTADSTDQVQETNEWNNAGQLFLTAPPPPNPWPPGPPAPPLPPIPHATRG